MGSQHLSLKWNDHQTNMLKVFEQCLCTESLVDVTLACEGRSLKAHKMVLSACSSFFQNLFLQNPCKHPIVIMKDIKYTELKAIVDFMYQGEVNVTQNQLSQLLQVAETLHVKGLSQLGLMGQKESTEIVQHAVDEPKQFGHRMKTEPGLNLSSLGKKKRQRRRSSSSSNNSDSNYKVKEAKLGNAHSGEMDLQNKMIDLAQSSSYHQTKCVPLPTQLSCCPQYDDEQSLNDDEYILAIHPDDTLRKSMEKDGSINDSVHDNPVSAENGFVDNCESPNFSMYSEYIPSVCPTPSLVSQKEKEAYELSYPTVSGHNSIKVEEDEDVQILDKFCSSTSITDDDDEEENHGNNDRNELCQENNSMSFACDTCNMYFKHRDDLIGHKRTIHSELRPCTYVEGDKGLSQDCHLVQSTQNHNADRRFKCHHCKRKFMMKSACIKHLRTHMAKSGSDNKQYNEETDSEEKNLLLYEKRDIVNRVYLCVICHKGFRSKSDLHKHHIIHTGQKPFACDKCGKRFNRKSNLDRHKKICGTKK